MANHSFGYSQSHPKSTSLKDIVAHEFNIMYNVADLGVKDIAQSARKITNDVKSFARNEYGFFLDLCDIITPSTALEHSPYFNLVYEPKSASFKDVAVQRLTSLYDVVSHNADRLNDWIQDISEEKYSAFIDNLEKTRLGKKVAKPIDAVVTAIVDATEVNTSIIAALIPSLAANYFGTNYYAHLINNAQDIMNISYGFESGVNTLGTIAAFLYVEHRKGVNFGRSVINLLEVSAVLGSLSFFGYRELKNDLSMMYKDAFGADYGTSTTVAQAALSIPFFTAGKLLLKATEDFKQEYVEERLQRAAYVRRLAFIKMVAGKDIVVTAVRSGVRKTNRGLRFVSAIGRLRRRSKNIEQELDQ